MHILKNEPLQCRLVIIAMVLLFAMLFLAGCNSVTSWGTAGSADAFEANSGVSAITGTPTPSVSAGGGTHVMLFTRPFENGLSTPTAIGYSRRKSLWGLFSGETASGNVSFLYIAGSAETPKDTQAILEAIAEVVNAKKATKDE